MDVSVVVDTAKELGGFHLGCALAHKIRQSQLKRVVFCAVALRDRLDRFVTQGDDAGFKKESTAKDDIFVCPLDA